jgi:hypothetical protein
MGYRVHFIGLKVNKNLDYEQALLLSVYTWCVNEKSPNCGVAQKSAIFTIKGCPRLQFFCAVHFGNFRSNTGHFSGSVLKSQSN